jgi:hypothetical protein
MKFPRDVLVQQIFKCIHDIQNIYAFKHTWEIFDIDTIVILGYEHLFLIHDAFIHDIEGDGDILV